MFKQHPLKEGIVGGKGSTMEKAPARYAQIVGCELATRTFTYYLSCLMNLNSFRWLRTAAPLMAAAISAHFIQAAPEWEPSGWGGGGFYYAAVFHPSRDGVIYLGGDVGGLYKTEDHGRSWRMINRGLADYGVFTLAADPSTPDTLYAATEGGLCKSVDGGENWRVLPKTGSKDLRITGEKNKSIRSVAVDPSQSARVYAGTPLGKVFRSEDGGESWALAWEKPMRAAPPNLLRAQFGQVNAAIFGGFWMPLAVPEEGGSIVGIGLRARAEGPMPQKAYFHIRTKDGVMYISRNLREIFAHSEMQDVVLRGEDFSIDPSFASQNPQKAAGATPKPDLSLTTRMDFSMVNPSSSGVSILWMEKIFFQRTARDGGPETVQTAREFSSKEGVQVYGNLRIGETLGDGPVYSVAISAKDPSLVAAATHSAGILLSHDHGVTWSPLDTPKKASSVVFDPADSRVLYATFFSEGVWKTTDQGATWRRISGAFPPGLSVREITVSPGNPQDVYVIGQNGWSGQLWISRDGGETWKSTTTLQADYAANPTLPQAGKMVPLSITTNVAVNPKNPLEIYLSANWRPAHSIDGGETLQESVKGADITCITDIRFSGDRVYVTAMDEGTLVSEDQGKTWKALWPLKHDRELSGHNWRLGVRSVDGQDHLLATANSWDGQGAAVVITSEDGGKTFKTSAQGLPAKHLTVNTLWERGYPRALALDPATSRVAYLGIDGDPVGNQPGGGVFKTEDGGSTWKLLPSQPASRRMYFGLAVDPKNPQRIYWAAHGKEGGMYRSEDGGGSWQHVFKDDPYLFNIAIGADGTVYAGGKELYASRDQGQTWKPVTHLRNNRSVVGIETHPTDPQTLWISDIVWSGAAIGGIYKTTDGGQTWAEITGNIPFVHPQILRFNPKTNELWAGWVGLYKLKQ